MLNRTAVHNAALPAASSCDIELLCHRAAQGDTNALDRLIRVHHARFIGFAKKKLGADWRGKLDPEDLLQDAYLDISGRIPGFEYQGEDSFYRWATTIIDHKFIDAVRALRRQKRDVMREQIFSQTTTSRAEALVNQFNAPGRRASAIIRRRDAAGAMLSAINRLPSEYREIVQRVHLAGQPFARAAADLGKSEDAVRRAAGRALEKLNQMLGGCSRWLSAA